MEERNSQSTHQQKQNTAKYGYIVGLAVNGTSVFVALISNSLIVVADVVIGLVETLSLFLTWMAMVRIAKGDQRKFNYGYGKLENMASIGIALALLISAGLITYGAVGRLYNPQVLNSVGAVTYIAITGISTGLNSLLWLKSYRMAREAPSPAIEAQSRLYSEKVISNLLIIVSLWAGVVFERFSFSGYIDPVVSLGMVVYIVIIAYNIFRKSVYDLLDCTLEENIQLVIMQALAANFDAYRDFHGVRSRRVGDSVFVEIFLEFDPDKTLEEVTREGIQKIKDHLEREIPRSQVLIIPSTSRMV